MVAKKGLILLFLLFFFSFQIVRAAEVNIDNVVTLSLEDNDPDPAKPGQAMDLYLSLSVVETDAMDVRLDEMEVEVFPECPFSVYPGTKRVASLGDLREGAVASFNYRLWVDDDAEPGIGRIRFKFTSDKVKSGISAPLEINVKRSDPRLEVSKVTLDPERIDQGSVAKMFLSLNNPTGAVMSDVTVSLGLPNEISPVGETNVKKIKQVDPGESVRISFNLMADSKAEAGAYKVPLEISFSDSQGTSYFRNETLGILVGSSPELQVGLEDQDVFTSGKKGVVVVSVSNVGPSEVRFLSLEVLESKDFEVLSPKNVYLGDLGSDDFETAQFDIYFNDVGTSSIPVRLEYKDAFNTPVSEEVDIPIQIYSSRVASRFGLIKRSNGPVTILLYVLLALFVIQWYKAWRREKDLVRGFVASLRKDLRLVGRFIVWVLRGFKSKR